MLGFSVRLFHDFSIYILLISKQLPLIVPLMKFIYGKFTIKVYLLMQKSNEVILNISFLLLIDRYKLSSDVWVRYIHILCVIPVRFHVARHITNLSANVIIAWPRRNSFYLNLWCLRSFPFIAAATQKCYVVGPWTNRVKSVAYLGWSLWWTHTKLRIVFIILAWGFSFHHEVIAIM